MACIADFVAPPNSLIPRTFYPIIFNQLRGSIVLGIIPGKGLISDVFATRAWTSALIRSMQLKGTATSATFVFGTKPSEFSKTIFGITSLDSEIKKDMLEQNFRRYQGRPMPRLDDKHGYEGMRWSIELIRTARIGEFQFRGDHSGWFRFDDEDYLIVPALMASTIDPVEKQFRAAWRAQAVWAYRNSIVWDRDDSEPLKNEMIGNEDESESSLDPVPANKSPVERVVAVWSTTFNEHYSRTYCDRMMAACAVLICLVSPLSSCWQLVQAHLQRVRFQADFVLDLPMNLLQFRDGKAKIVDVTADDVRPMLVASSNDGSRAHYETVIDPPYDLDHRKIWLLHQCLSNTVIKVQEEDRMSTISLLATEINSVAALLIVAIWSNVAALLFTFVAFVHMIVAAKHNEQLALFKGKHSRDSQFNQALAKSNSEFSPIL